jgi:hypothetical protein
MSISNAKKLQCVFAAGTHDEDLGASWKVRDGPVPQAEVLNAVVAREETEGWHKDLQIEIGGRRGEANLSQSGQIDVRWSVET